MGRRRMLRRPRGQLRSLSMSTITPIRTEPSSAPLAAPEVYRMTVDEYERIADADILDDDRVELIDGYLVRKMPKKPPHVWAVDAILEALRATLPGWWCSREGPVGIRKGDETEAGGAVGRGSRVDVRGRMPRSKEKSLRRV